MVMFWSLPARTPAKMNAIIVPINEYNQPFNKMLNMSRTIIRTKKKTTTRIGMSVARQALNNSLPIYKVGKRICGA